jgi:parallel beta-helix repeat protein
LAGVTRMLLLALVGCTLLAAPANAAHVACGDTIAQDTTLDSDLEDCPADGLVITANDVTIDFAGHTVDGIGNGNGVYPERHVNRFLLVGGTIAQFIFGVYSEQPRGLLDTMRILDNLYYGVQANAEGTEVRNSLIAGNEAGSEGPSRVTGSTFVANREFGIRTGAEDAHITGNVVRRNGVGILVEEGSGSVAGNVVTDNPDSGISWNFSGGGAIRGNFVARNGFGISVHSESSADPIIEHNTVLANHSHGIRGHWEGRGSVVTRNDVRRNGGSGIFATGLRPCPELRDNHVARNGQDGISVGELFAENLGVPSECDVLPVTGNTAGRNGADGIHVAGNTVPVLLERNRTHHNGDLGIEALAGALDGGGNTAKHNADRRQCVGVTCR